MAWNKNKPGDIDQVKTSPAVIRDNWQAIETGTDPALLITNAKVSASAGIVDSKLATISTAGKVNGTALTGLASVPSGAGVLPTANIPSIDGSKLTGLAKIPSDSGVIPVANIPDLNASKITAGTLPNERGGTGSTAKANSASGVVILDANSKLPAVDGSLLTGIVVPDASITTAKVKTAVGELSIEAGGYFTITGGEYCFYPQRKVATAGTFHTGIGTWGGENTNYTPTSYTTSLFASNWPGGTGRMVRTRYLTASGKDFWIFVLSEKATGKILAMSAAPDHPAYGNSNDFTLQAHPFQSFDPATQEVTLIDGAEAKAIRADALSSKSGVLDHIEAKFKMDKTREGIYVPIHSGKFSPDLEPVLVETIPSYMKVRHMAELSAAEKDKRLEDHALSLAAEQVKQTERAEKKDRILSKMGISAEEFAALVSM